MTSRRLGFAVFSVCLAMYVPACEYDPNTGKPYGQATNMRAVELAPEVQTPVVTPAPVFLDRASFDRDCFDRDWSDRDWSDRAAQPTPLQLTS